MKLFLRLSVYFIIGVIVLFLCLVVIPTWLFPHADYLAKDKAHAGLIQTQEHIKVLRELCNQGLLVTDSTNNDINLDEPESYGFGYVKSVKTLVENEHNVLITITYNALFTDWGLLKFKEAPAGSKLIMEGECSTGQLTWQYKGDLPNKLKPRF